jgi:hypothetical protein
MALGQASDLQSETPNQPDTATVFEHCPFCLLAADRMAPPPATLDHVLSGTATYELAGLAQTFFVVAHTDPTPPARGPPLFS